MPLLALNRRCARVRFNLMESHVISCDLMYIQLITIAYRVSLTVHEYIIGWQESYNKDNSGIVCKNQKTRSICLDPELASWASPVDMISRFSVELKVVFLENLPHLFLGIGIGLSQRAWATSSWHDRYDRYRYDDLGLVGSCRTQIMSVVLDLKSRTIKHGN